MTTPSDAAPEAPAGALPEPGRLSPDVMTELAVSDGRGSASDLAEFQRAAWSNLVLSVTQRCPLTCRHCITSSLPGSRLPLLTIEQARSWAFELPELRQRGLEHITFTGGEPTLARSAVRIPADAAAADGLATTIVTSGAFATSRRAAHRTVSMLGSIGHWDLGYDTF